MAGFTSTRLPECLHRPPQRVPRPRECVHSWSERIQLCREWNNYTESERRHGMKWPPMAGETTSEDPGRRPSGSGSPEQLKEPMRALMFAPTADVPR